MQEFGGVLFEVQGLIQLQGQCWVKRGYVLPERVPGIPVHHTAQRVHILHANSGFGDPLGTPGARLVLNYQDGNQSDLEIRHRENGLDFWAWKPTIRHEHGRCLDRRKSSDQTARLRSQAMPNYV